MESEGKVACQEEWEALGQVIVPVVPTVEYCKRLGDVEVEPLIWWKCPLSEVKPI